MYEESTRCFLAYRKVKNEEKGNPKKENGGISQTGQRENRRFFGL